MAYESIVQIVGDAYVAKTIPRLFCDKCLAASMALAGLDYAPTRSRAMDIDKMYDT